MAFSGSTDFTYTRDQLIKAALRKCRAYDVELGAPEAYQITAGAEALNLIAKQLAPEGVTLWMKSFKEAMLTKSKRTYTIGPSGDINMVRPLRIYDILLRDISTNTDTPMNQYSRSDYQMLTDKFTTGTPVNVYYDRTIDNSEIFVWPVPADSKHKLVFTADLPLEDFDASGDTAYVPSYAYGYLLWQLAYDLSFEYGIPKDQRDDWLLRAERLKALLLGFEEEVGGFQLIPDTSGEW